MEREDLAQPLVQHHAEECVAEWEPVNMQASLMSSLFYRTREMNAERVIDSHTNTTHEEKVSITRVCIVPFSNMYMTKVYDRNAWDHIGRYLN